MKFLDLTLPTPAENLALDEALLDASEKNGGPEILRVWEPANYFVVVGYANKIELEVNAAAAREFTTPIFRRCSGGGTVLQGPGCLNYALILKISEGISDTVTGANRLVMEKNRDALRQIPGAIEIRGITDLTRGDLKFSGNAQRRRKDFFLFHGTFLLNFDLTMIEKLLRPPSKEPEYRAHRSHREFLTNLTIPTSDLKQLLRSAWQADELLKAIPDYVTLARERYASEEWNFKF